MDYPFPGQEQLLLACWEETAIGLVSGSYSLHPLRGTFLSSVASRMRVGQDNAGPQLDTPLRTSFPLPPEPASWVQNLQPSARNGATPSLMPSCSHRQIVHNKRSHFYFVKGPTN